MPDDTREQAKARAREMIADGLITSPEELRSFMDSQGVQARTATPRTGLSDREPTVGGGYGMLAKVGEKVAGAGREAVGAGWGAIQGLVSNFADEGMDLATGIPGTGKAVLGRAKEMSSPVSRFAGEVAGGIGQGMAFGAAAPAALVAKVDRGRSVIDPALRAAVGGGLGGAAAAAGAAEGGAADRGMAALLGGGLGLVAGGTVGAGAGLMRGIKNTFNPSPTRIAEEGDRVISDILRRSGKTVDEASGELAALRGRGMDARAVDVLGKPGQKALSVLEGRSEDGAEAASKALGARQRDLGPKLADTFLEAAKLGEAPDAGAMVQDIIERRSAKAAPAYKAALEEGVQVTDEGVRSILSQPRWQQAYQVADELRLVNGEPPLPPVYDGDGNVLPTVDLRALHWTKLGMDDLLSRQGETNVGKQLKRGIGQQVRTVMAAAKAASPKYAAAADEFAGESELLDAIELGKGFLTKNPNVIQRELADLSPAGREAYQARVIEDMVQRLGNVKGTGDPSRIFDTPNMTQRLRTLFGDEADKVMQGIRDVEQLSSTYRATQGSRTFPMQATEEQLAQGMGQVGVELSRGNVLTALARPVMSGVARAARGATGRVGDDVARRLMSEDLTLQRALNDLTARRSLARSAATGNVTASAMFGGFQ